MPYAAITENDESQWDDEPGVRYHFPKRYAKFLPPGTFVVYYKSWIKNRIFASSRLTKNRHYFAFARIGSVSPDTASTKGDLFAAIEDYRPLDLPVLAKSNGEQFEEIPDSRASNYWRDGVRPITEKVYRRIRQAAGLDDRNVFNDSLQGKPSSLESGVEGQPKKRFVTTYERNPALRARAMELHGTTCAVCEFNFGTFYGEAGAGYIHIHHVKPVSELGGPSIVDPSTDMTPVCANCHAIIHRRRDKTLSVIELRAMITKRSGLNQSPS